jgi:transposase-like protein
MDIVGLATAGIGTVLTKGLGRFVIGVRPGTAALRGTVAQIAGGRARTAQDALERGVADYTRAGNATRIGDRANSLRRWGQQYLDHAGGRATDAGRQAADDVHAGTVTRVSRTEQVRALDAELATDLAELRRLDDMLGGPLHRELEELARMGNWAVRANATGLGAQLADSADEGLAWKDPLERSASAAWRLTH